MFRKIALLMAVFMLTIGSFSQVAISQENAGENQEFRYEWESPAKPSWLEESKTDSHGTYLYHKTEMGLGSDGFFIKNNIPSTYFDEPGYGERVRLGNTSEGWGAKLYVEHSYGGRRIRVKVGGSYRRLLDGGEEEKITGWMDDPWDVYYYQGVRPIESIEPYAGVTFNFTDYLSLDLLVGSPYTYLKYRKMYKEQQYDFRVTVLEHDSAKEFGISEHVRLSFLKGYETARLFIEYSREDYHPELLGKERKVGINRFEIGLSFKLYSQWL